MPGDEGTTNWSGNYAYRARLIHRPASLEELQSIVAGAPRIRALGSRHSFTAIADAEELVSLERLPGEIAIDPASATVSVSAQTTYAQLAEGLNRAGWALDNLASLPHICVAGAVATGTHGSGWGKGNLASAVRELELVTATGEILRVGTDDARFRGMVVGLGSLGVVTRVTLAIEPYYEMRQRVYEGPGWAAFFDHLEEICAAGDSVSVFHLLGPRTEQVWVKQRMDRRQGEGALPAALHATRPADEPRHPVLGGDPVNTTEQLGIPGPWSERLPHFRSGFLPSAGEELQSEFFVARSDAAAAVEAVRGLAATIVPLLLVGELRTITADDLWLSPQHGRDSFALHFTWRRRPAEVEAAVAAIEAALAPWAARPHWGKVFTAEADHISALYPRLADFRRLRDQLDPSDTFVNDWLIRHVLGAG